MSYRVVDMREDMPSLRQRHGTRHRTSFFSMCQTGDAKGWEQMPRSDRGGWNPPLRLDAPACVYKRVGHTQADGSGSVHTGGARFPNAELSRIITDKPRGLPPFPI